MIKLLQRERSEQTSKSTANNKHRNTNTNLFFTLQPLFIVLAFAPVTITCNSCVLSAVTIKMTMNGNKFIDGSNNNLVLFDCSFILQILRAKIRIEFLSTMFLA